MRLLSLVALLFAVGCTDRADPSGPAVLSLASANADGAVALSPIAVIEGGMLRPTGGESQDQQTAFLTDHFAVGHLHPLLVGGQQVGTVAVASADVAEIGAGYEIRGTAQLDGPMPIEWLGLSGVAGSSRALRRSVTPAERRIFLDVASGQMRSRWRDFDRDALQWGLRAVALEGFGRPVLVGTVETHAPYGVMDSFGESAEYTAFVVAEIGEGGAYQGVFSRLGEGTGYEDGEGKASLVDVADLDGDGAPEVVIEISRYEGIDYAIYGRRDGRWQLLFSGGYVGV